MKYSQDVFLGPGGHGCLSIFSDYLFKPNFKPSLESNIESNISPDSKTNNRTNNKNKNGAKPIPKNLILATIDSGGNTGTQQDLLKLKGGQLNQMIHGDSNFQNIPFGDLKQFVSKFLEIQQQNLNLQTSSPRLQALKNSQNQPTQPKPAKDQAFDQSIQVKTCIADVIDFRSDDYQQQLDNFYKLKQLHFYWIHSQASLLKELDWFMVYLKNYLDFYQKNKYLLPLDRQTKTCFGNLFFSFLYFLAVQKKTPFNKILQQLKLAPSWINYYFVSKNKLVLKAKDIYGVQIWEEGIIDEWDKPILPQSHQLLDLHSAQSNKQVFSSHILNLLKLPTARVIISPGSDANWLGITNNFEVKARLQEKSKQGDVFWIPNLYTHKNETTLTYTLNYLLSQKVCPKLYLPDELNLLVPKLKQTYQNHGLDPKDYLKLNYIKTQASQNLKYQKTYSQSYGFLS